MYKFVESASATVEVLQIDLYNGIMLQPVNNSLHL